MKKITFLSMLLTVTFGFSQNVPVDFETAGNGADWTWTVFENTATPPPLEIIPNPVSGGINTSATVAKYTVLPTAGNFAGTETQLGADIGTWTVTDQNAIVKVMVYQVGFNSTVGVKFTNNSASPINEVTQVVPAGDEWVELSFNMSGWIGNGNNPANQFVMFVDLGGARNGAERIVYFDNISFSALPAPTCTDGIQNGDETGVDCGGSSCAECPPPPKPSVAAPTPTVDAADVINVFSDFYGPNTAQGANAGATWGGNPASNLDSYSSETIDGSVSTDFMHFYQGTNLVFIPWTPVDATEMQYLHLDIWSANSNFIIINIQNNASPPQGQIVVNDLVPNQWKSVEITLPGPADRTGLFQLVLDAAGGKDYYFDNIYFSKVSTLDVNSFTAASFKVYPNPSKSDWNVESTSTIRSIEVYDILGKRVSRLSPNQNNAAISSSNLKSGIYFARLTSDNGSKTLKLIKE